jgi:hypothetical protein
MLLSALLYTILNLKVFIKMGAASIIVKYEYLAMIVVTLHKHPLYVEDGAMFASLYLPPVTLKLCCFVI